MKTSTEHSSQSRNNEDLLPCPFCGRAPEHYFVTGTAFHWCVVCKSCGARREEYARTGNSRSDPARQKVVDEWNRRIETSSEKEPKQLPESWRIRLDHEHKQAIVWHPNLGSYAATDNPDNIAGTVLYWLAVALIRSGHYKEQL